MILSAEQFEQASTTEQCWQLSGEQLRELYSRGFPGAPLDRAEFARQMSRQKLPAFEALTGEVSEDEALDFDTILLHTAAQRHRADFGDNDAQETGDCVGASIEHATFGDMCVEVDLQGQSEVIQPQGFAREVTYGYRGFRGQGMDPARAIQFIKDAGGVVRRDKYPFGDLSEYNVDLGIRWGGTGLPREAIEIARQHPVDGCTEITSAVGALVALRKLNFLLIASDQGFNSRRDNDGFVGFEGSWSHQMWAMAARGKRTGRAGILIGNNWGPNWISGPTKYNQPLGSFWVDWNLFKRWFQSASVYMLGDLRGWQRPMVESYGYTFV